METSCGGRHVTSRATQGRWGDGVTTATAGMQGMSNDLFLDDAENIRRYTEAFNHLRNLATDPPATTRLLTSLAKAF